MLELELEDELQQELGEVFGEWEVEQTRATAPGRWNRAISRNRYFARVLGWRAYKYAIIRLLGFPSAVPTEAQFAAAVARWQRAQGGLAPDGIIGPFTLRRIQVALKSLQVFPGDTPGNAVTMQEMPADPGEMRRLYREFKPQVGDAAEKFVTEVAGGIPEGHQSLTRMAVGALPITGAALTALLDGVKRVDDPLKAFTASEQKRHTLRREVCQPVADAYREAVSHLIFLHRSALLAPLPVVRFGLIGEALHLIQDSFSPAHTERNWGGAGGLHPMVFIRSFSFVSLPFPIEHQMPADPRDIVRLPFASRLLPWPEESVTASHDFLVMMLRHIASPRSPAILSELRRFITRHLSLSPSHIPTSRFYGRLCPP